MAKTPALTTRSIEALEWARDHGSAWNYAPNRSLPWSAQRQKMLNRLVGLGLLDRDHRQITDAGRAAIG